MAPKKTSKRRTRANAPHVRVCTEKHLPDDVAIAAGERALAERRANAPARLGTRGASASRRLRMAVEAEKKWKVGRRLKVAFVGGQPSIQAKVEHFARLWEQHANIQLDFGPHSNAEIRISFDQIDGGSWSYVGTDCLTARKSEATMNFGWLDTDTDDTEYERVVVHEFGHALGCIHEHQSPTGNIPWDKPKVYAYYARQDWSKEDVDQNIFEKYSHEQVNATEFDARSIMLYAVPNSLTIGDFEIGWNTRLSDRDKTWIATQYPKTASAVPTLTVGGPPALAMIGAHGEIDVFEFSIAKRGRHRLETSGKTDVVMTLWGPDDRDDKIAEDDDGGMARNARITATLEAGRYWATVRHYERRGTGSYGVQLTKA